jgi:hypothetical protein
MLRSAGKCPDEPKQADKILNKIVIPRDSGIFRVILTWAIQVLHEGI